MGEGSVEAWGRSPENPVKGRYGLRNGDRGRFGMYLPPLLEKLGLAEVTHDAQQPNAGDLIPSTRLNRAALKFNLSVATGFE
jgi:hypothetical protein